MSYLKMKLQADRNIALDLEKALRVIQQDALNTARGLSSGAERLSWYGSCMFEDYRDVCKQLTQEDMRMLSTLRQVYRRHDVVLDMVEIYFRKKLSRISEQGQQKIINAIIDKGIKYASEKAGKTALALLIAQLITASHKFRTSHINLINTTSLTAVRVISFYGKMQKAALSTRKLRFNDAEYYFDLYNQNLELLYFLIEPEMTKIIFMIKSGSNKEDEIIYLMNEMLSK